MDALQPSLRQLFSPCIGSRLVLCAMFIFGSVSACSSVGPAERNEPVVMPLGWVLPVAEVPATVEKAYEKAQAEFQSGELEYARQDFSGVLASAPLWVRARFDLARTLSLLGQVEEAAKHIEVVLRADLPGYLHLVREDSALQNVRDVESGIGLGQKISSLRDRWEATVADGWPTIEFRAAPELREGEPPEYYPKHSVRAGVFVPSTQRFLPVGGITPDAAALLVDAGTRRVLSVQADATVDLFSQMFNVSWRVEPWLPETPSAVMLGSPDEDDATFAAIDFSLGPGATVLRMFEEFEDITTEASDAQGERGAVLRVLGEGSLLLYSAADGYRLSENQLTLSDGSRIQLGSGHEQSSYNSYVEDEGGLYVLSTGYGCDPSKPEAPAVPKQSHVVDYVDFKTGAVSRISEGFGAASAVLFPDGRLALQRGQRLDVLAPGEHSLKNAQALPAGVLLHVPLRTPNCVYH